VLLFTALVLVLQSLLCFGRKSENIDVYDIEIFNDLVTVFIYMIAAQKIDDPYITCSAKTKSLQSFVYCL
jgi:hypothetical protein